MIDVGARNLSKRIWAGFLLECILLVGSVPILYLMDLSWMTVVALAMLACTWVVRRVTIGVWFQPTPVDLLLILFFVFLIPLSIWASPPTLRPIYTLPRAMILLWNGAAFSTIVTYGANHHRLRQLAISGLILIGVGLALVAPLGMNWLYKIGVLRPILSRIPSVLVGIFQGAESGFHPNQVAGTLLYILPHCCGFLLASIFFTRWAILWRSSQFWLITLATGIMSITFLLTQSRSGILAFAFSLLCLLVILSVYHWRSRAVVALILTFGLIGVFVTQEGILGQITELAIDFLRVTPAGLTSHTLQQFRVEIWTYAIAALHDFSVTGMGLGTFRELVRILYPITITPSYDIAHAHNIFMQAGLDFGLLGMAVLLALYLSGLVASISLIRQNVSTANRAWGCGFIMALIAQMSYGLLDTVAMGSKTNIVFWYFFAVLFGLFLNAHKKKKHYANTNLSA
ncbi:MAG: O-antigen ligase family protein [Chloroflexota bacterium]